MKKSLLIMTTALLVSLGSCAQTQTKNAPAKANKDVVVKMLPAGLVTEDIMSTIVSEFPGKVVVVDYWATWCGPCMAAMKQIDPIKEQYAKAKKPVVFVYITGETSPLDKWEAAIPAIKGYHYRLTSQEYNGLMKSLGIRGIPTYAIYGKDGKLVYDNIATGGYPGDEVITSQIESALNKK